MEYHTVLCICILLCGLMIRGTLGGEGIAETIGGGFGRVMDSFNPFRHDHAGGYGGRNDNMLPTDTKNGYGGSRGGYGEGRSNDRSYGGNQYGASNQGYGDRDQGFDTHGRQAGQGGSQSYDMQGVHEYKEETGQTGNIKRVDHYRDETSRIAGAGAESITGAGGSAGGGAGAGAGFGGNFGGIPFGAHKEVEGGVSDSGFGAKEHYGANIGGFGFEVEKSVGGGITRDGLMGGIGSAGGVGAVGSARDENGHRGGHSGLGGVMGTRFEAHKEVAGAIANGAEVVANKGGYGK